MCGSSGFGSFQIPFLKYLFCIVEIYKNALAWDCMQTMIVKYFVVSSILLPSSIDLVMMHVAEEGHESVVPLCRDLGATDTEQTMLCAANNGRKSILRLCYDWGAEDLGTVIVHALVTLGS